MTDESRKQKGLALAKQLFEGSKGFTKLPAALSAYTIEHLFGDVWQQQNLLSGFKHYFNFRGRATKAEFWYFLLSRYRPAPALLPPTKIIKATDQ